MKLTRLLIGLLGFLHGLWFLRGGYIESRSGESFVLPIYDWIPTNQWIEITALTLIVVGSLLVAFNVRLRVTATVVALSFAYILFSDWSAFHHSTFLAANLFALLAWSGSTRADSKKAAGIAIQFLVGCVYIFAGLHKLLGDGFRSGLVIEEVSTFISQWIMVHFAGFVPLSVWGTIVIELFITFALLHRKTRVWAAILGIGFHIMILAFTARGALFNMYLPACYPLFLTAEIARLFNWLTPRVPSSIRGLIARLQEPESLVMNTEGAGYASAPPKDSPTKR